MQEIISLVLMTLAAVLAIAVAIYYRPPQQAIKPPDQPVSSPSPTPSELPPASGFSRVPAAPWYISPLPPSNTNSPPSENGNDSEPVTGRW